MKIEFIQNIDKIEVKKKIKIIDILCYISIGENDKIPKKVKWRDSIWEYDDRNQDYVHKESMLFEQNKFIRTKEFLNDEVEILDEKDEFEDIEEIIGEVERDKTLSHDECMQGIVSNFNLLIEKINLLIKNQKLLIEGLNNERD